MPWLIVVLGYFLGSIPTAYIAGHLLKGRDIRQMGDGNVGAANAFHQLGATAGIVVFFVDASKGALAILIAQAVSIPQLAILTAGVAAVIGHNWPVFIGFRGGRGESTTIGVLMALVTQPMLIVVGPAVLILLINKEGNSSQCPFVCPPAAGVLVAWSSRSAFNLQYGSTLPRRLHPFPKDEADCGTPSLGILASSGTAG